MRKIVELASEAVHIVGIQYERAVARERGLVKRKTFTYTQRDKIIGGRDRPWVPCVACGSVENLCVDHILPLSRGGTNDPENLQSLCRDCNAYKGDDKTTDEVREWRMKK